MDELARAEQGEGALARVLGAVVVLAAACWLCIYPVALVAVGLALLVFVPQGYELLEATARHDALDFKLTFHAAVAIWALSAWYCSRVLLRRRFPGRFSSPALDSGAGFAVRVRIWLPRVLGAAIYLSLAVFFFAVARERLEAFIMLGAGIAYGLFVVYRSALLRGVHAAAARRDQLDRTTRVVLSISLLLSVALLVGFLISEVDLPRRLGAAPIILLAFSSWILFGSIVLVLLPKTYGLPSLALLPVFLALAAGGVDNHEVRRLPPDLRAASIQASALDWLKANEQEFRRARSEGRESFPVYIVAAEGGGLRAAYWTARVLGELESATGGRFSRRLFAISGVSGGSLGGASFVAELAVPGACNAPEGTSVRDCLRHFLKGDFLSPMVAYLLFPDAMQRLMPFAPVRRFDRARALERSWERSWAATHPAAAVNPFAASYDALGADPALPRLFLNGTRVETGKRALVSPARFDEDELPEVDDLLAAGGKPWSVPLSTAVHLSARFAYVSPAAKICKAAASTCDDEQVWGRVVDGGYHENSGAQTAAGLLRALRRAAREFEAGQPAGRTRIQPQVILITNDPRSTRLCDAPLPIEAGEAFTELLSPFAALWNARTARGDAARRALADAAAGLQRDPLDTDCAGDGTRARTLEFALAGAAGDDRPPALGWFLAVGSITRMDNALCHTRHVQALSSVQRDLGGPGAYRCE